MSFRLYAPTDCGADGYPAEWHATIKHDVRATAENRCVRCGHPYPPGGGEWSNCDAHCTHAGPVRELESGIVQARWRILTVHHLNGDKFDCRWWNLVALCQRCHLHIQGKVQMARVWPWEHSDWFQPYVAGYYAFAYLGEELSREEVAGRLNELLALERQVA